MENNKNKIYTAALLVIGNEILSGRTKDENINYIANQLTSQGISLLEVRVIRDIERDIIDSVNHLRKAHDYVFTTGGIGPTHDDITVEAIAKAFEVKYVLNQEAYKILLEHYGSHEKINSSRIRMAYVPEGSTLINNEISKAPGIKMDNVYILAGVPSIMQSMFKSLIGSLKFGDPILSCEINCPIPEGEIASDLKILQDKLLNVEIGSYPYYGRSKVGTKLVLRTTDSNLLEIVAVKVCDLVKSYGVQPVVEK